MLVQIHHILAKCSRMWQAKHFGAVWHSNDFTANICTYAVPSDYIYLLLTLQVIFLYIKMHSNRGFMSKFYIFVATRGKKRVDVKEL